MLVSDKTLACSVEKFPTLILACVLVRQDAHTCTLGA